MNFLIFSTLDSNFPAIFTHIIFMFVYADSPLFFFVVITLSFTFLGDDCFWGICFGLLIISFSI
jgi:hypothetical protein